MAQGLRPLVILAKDRNSIPSTHMEVHNLPRHAAQKWCTIYKQAKHSYMQNKKIKNLERKKKKDLLLRKKKGSLKNMSMGSSMNC